MSAPARFSLCPSGLRRVWRLAAAPALAALALGAPPAARGQTVVQEFSGSGAATTATFTVKDRWEVRWNAREVVSVAAMTPDGVLVAGAAGVLRGSLFVPAGGTYYLRVTDGTTAPPSSPSTNTPAADAPATNAPPAAQTNAASLTNAAPPTSPPSSPNPAAFLIDDDKAAAPAVAWHVQVVQLTAGAAAESLTVYTPYFAVPDAALVPATPPPALPPPQMSPEQLRALVTIKGDRAGGNGFLVKSPDGPAVVTHLHLLAANPNLQVFSAAGTALKVLSIKAAADRDLALLAVRDDHLSCLPLPTADAAAVPGDDVILPVIGQADGPPSRPAKVIADDADRIDFAAEVDPASVGLPVIRATGGEALGIVTAEKRVDLTEGIARAWPGNPAPGSARIIPFYGLRLAGVSGWEALDWDRYQRETSVLHDFHETTRSLDSFLNGRRRRHGTADPDGPPDNHDFTANAAIVAASQNYHKTVAGADRMESLDAARELLFDLVSVAGADLAPLQDAGAFSPCNQAQVREELAYRRALRAELDALSDNIPRLDGIARSR
ncbi:MAG: hypothetical protein WDO13_14640 [Verrucomicrobiota bacterium]